jgi:lactate dehydrogenase-like 2-hydroxyacid dehydrogenase
MIPVNSVLQVGQFPEIMQGEIDRRLSTTKLLDPQGKAPAGNFTAILTRSNTLIPKELLEQIPSIRMVATCGVGYDNLPLAYLQAKGIKASNTPGVLNDACCLVSCVAFPRRRSL